MAQLDFMHECDDLIPDFHYSNGGIWMGLVIDSLTVTSLPGLDLISY